ncbi:hypothetical protein TI39_contig5939g00002 [Zymoseptoria brevis]|uniref:Uncharacterized protein n=1 Tax=Zymoseptoria brevis TaxID=1047168 RepID=A0A0F4G737_9PEZI|nr:hypothetical protein TI39_contig5939g00002 [Zymoseptoria brevis]
MGEAYHILEDFANLRVAGSKVGRGALGLEACKAQLVQLAKETIQRAQQIQDPPRAGKHASQDIADIGALNAICHRLIQACRLWNEASIQSVCDLVLRQVGGDEKLQQYFRREIQSILESFQTHQPHDGMLRRALEECYNQASSSSGTLHIDNYFIDLEESYLESPYDSDFESDLYYEHEARLEIDENYAAAHRARQLRQGNSRREHKKVQQKSWALVWLRAMEECAEGPTLFRFLTDVDVSASPSRWAKVPRYLIRVSDPSSPGSSNAQVVASVAWKFGDTLADTKDICAMEPATAALRLRNHLAPKRSEPTSSVASADRADNLMSWTSSLLFAIQYAIYRHHQNRLSTEHIKICVVDTRKFPRRQFARDLCLLHLHNNPEEDPFSANLENIIHLRERLGYDNGEYLTQGIVHLEGRSCIFSLKDLVDAGL